MERKKIGMVLAEFLGTAILASLVLAQVNAVGAILSSPWYVAATAGLTLGILVLTFARVSGAHFNPAITIGLWTIKKVPTTNAIVYVAAQMLGAALGAFLVWAHYLPHFAATDDKDAKLGVFCTGPAIRHTPSNFMGEVIGTFVLVYAALHITSPTGGLGSLDALPIGFVVLVIGLALGGTTGYAINPARDLGPRVAHALLPIAGKGTSGWDYAAIPIVGPIVGGVLAGLAVGAIGI